jgi:histidinol dehydrogenase
MFNKEGFINLADTVESIADIEGLDAHANTVRIRKGYIS